MRYFFMLCTCVMLLHTSCSDRFYVYGTAIKAKDIAGVKNFLPANQLYYSPMFEPIALILSDKYEKLGRLTENGNYRESLDFLDISKRSNEFSEIDKINIDYLNYYVQPHLGEFNLTKKENETFKLLLPQLKTLLDAKKYVEYKGLLFTEKYEFLRKKLFNEFMFVSYPTTFKIDDKIKDSLDFLVKVDIKADLNQAIGEVTDSLNINLNRIIDKTTIIEGTFYTVSFRPVYEDMVREYFREKQKVNEVKSTFDKRLKTVLNDSISTYRMVSSSIIFDIKVNNDVIRTINTEIFNELKGKLNEDELEKVKTKVNITTDYRRNRNTTINTATEKIYLIYFGFDSRIQGYLNRNSSKRS